MKKSFIALCLCIGIFSCKNEEKANNNETNAETENKEESYNQLKYTFNLPDTITVNRPYKATIEFKSDFDSIIDPLQAGGKALEDPTKDRLITFYHYEPVKSTVKSNENMILIDSTFVLNKSFDIDNIVFKEKGEFVFRGMILDKMRYQGYNEKGILNSVRFESLKQQIRKKVVVIDK
ncbi:hypothetical protein MG290_08370 [Flavobacterium sp. CBA20B-1]|uniref:hypothetical protein n=1 Tax=unclassified Flavobacterium TaxID=196869 RepID=UPI002224E81E|nr:MULTISPECIES: hypothetical protein [unclassified Flavobacterium]WCM40977.1 hypothetical protein MG290_08370 [Flavobacterium sp. CBA20B-1]